MAVVKTVLVDPVLVGDFAPFWDLCFCFLVGIGMFTVRDFDPQPCVIL